MPDKLSRFRLPSEGLNMLSTARTLLMLCGRVLSRRRIVLVVSLRSDTFRIVSGKRKRSY